MENPGCSHHAPREEGQSCSPIVSFFLTISLDFTIIYLEKFKKESPTMAVLLFLHLRYCKDFLGEGH